MAEKTANLFFIIYSNVNVFLYDVNFRLHNKKMILSDLIFKGFYTQNFVIRNYTFTLSTLSIEDEQFIANLENTRKTKIDDVFFIINVLSKTIVSINDIKVKQTYACLLKLPITFLIKIYEKYKELTDIIIKDITPITTDVPNSPPHRFPGINA